MPKYCSVPNCRTDSSSGSERKSFYRFPLQEPVRLQQWLRNMGRENWTPSRHQYICHQHFAPSCFRMRWGIRYIEKNAVPTIFQPVEKRKTTDQEERSLKRRRGDSGQSTTVTDDWTFTLGTAETQSSLHTVHLDTLVEHSEKGEQNLSDARESDLTFHTDVEPPVSGDEHEADLHIPLTLFQAEDQLSHSKEEDEVLLMSGEGQDELVKVFTAAILSQGHRLIINNNQLVAVDATQGAMYAAEELLDVHQGEETQIFAFYETLPPGLGQFSLSPETVLSNALSSKPITSTLPIVSKHAAAATAAPVLATERAEADEDRSEEEDSEQQDHQLQEHCYHKNSLSKEQLEAMVAELQKKVKVLQQRHRRHLEKLLGLENTVSQLRQNNMLNEERLQLLERAYVQTSSAMSDAGETVTIIYEEDDGAYLYTPLNSVEAEL